MRQLQVDLGDRSYPIYIGAGLLKEAGRLIRGAYGGTRAVLLSDDLVWPLYGEALTRALDGAGIRISPVILPHGEGMKTLANLEQLLEAMARAGLTRDSALIALGGGVVGDLGGFAAGVYMRGIPFIQIPTTLLAQVDSSVGGKTAVNLRHGKNLAGIFWQPRLVLADTDTLETLPERELAGGMAEVVKYGAIRSRALFDSLAEISSLSGLTACFPEVIYACCDCKRQLVERDERDTGARMLLNFGHTFGHAIEKLGNYETYIHGEAVAMGMVLAARLGEALGVTTAGVATSISALCSGFQLPVETEITVKALLPHMELDKKAGDGGLRLILLRDIGDAFIYKTSISELEACFHAD